jgi:hypothetical protein
MSGNVPGADK